MLQIDHTAPFQLDRRDAVDRALHGIIEHHRPTKTSRLIPRTGKTLGPFPSFQIIGGDAQHTHSMRGGINSADRRKHNQKLPRPFGRPAIMPIAGEKDRGEFGIIGQFGLRSLRGITDMVQYVNSC